MTAEELLFLINVLQLPNDIYTRAGYHFDSVEVFALTCARLASPSDEFTLCTHYNWSQSSISEIFNEVITILDECWSHLLHFDSDHLLSPKNLQQYLEAVYKSGAPL